MLKAIVRLSAHEGNTGAAQQKAKQRSVNSPTPAETAAPHAPRSTRRRRAARAAAAITRAPFFCRRTSYRPRPARKHNARKRRVGFADTQTGMLLGKSQERNVRSKFR